MEILEKIDKALQRMKKKGFENTCWYKELETKKKAIQSGAQYQVYDVTKDVLKACAVLLWSCQYNTKGRRFLFITEEVIKSIDKNDL